MADDLIAFLNARLDEDEAAAKAWLPFGNPDAAAREHIARHDPARVLREVQAMRAILAAHPHVTQPWGFGCEVCDNDDGNLLCTGWCPTVRALGTFYGDRPGYRQEWATAIPVT
jgi:hypothetical protein